MLSLTWRQIRSDVRDYSSRLHCASLPAKGEENLPFDLTSLRLTHQFTGVPAPEVDAATDGDNVADADVSTYQPLGLMA